MMPGDVLNSAQRSLLSRATSATSEPTPGYVYKDVTDMVASNLSILSAVEDYLLHKLARPEPYVKVKCLKLLKNLCNRLPQDFHRNKVCQCYAVMECRSYKAPYSEYNGDYLCQMVRNEVEELLKTVYENQNSTHPGGTHGAVTQERMVGFGNTPAMQNISRNPAGGSNVGYGGGGNNAQYPGNVGAGKMEGFGNYVPPRSSSHSNGNTAFKLISDVASKYLPSSLFGKIEQVGSAITSTAIDQIERHLSSNSDGHVHVPPAGYSTSFATMASNSSISSSKYRSQDIKMEKSLLPSLIENSDIQRGAADDVSGDAETKLVKEILTFSGIKVVPSQQIINDFLTRIKEVNVKYVVDELLQNINNRANKWQLQLRILCIFEALIISDHMPADVREHLRRELEPILVKCREESQLRNKTDRLMQLLGGRQDSARSADPFITGTTDAGTRHDDTTSRQKAATIDIFSELVPNSNTNNMGRTTLNVPSDFTNPAFDLMDSFTPVSSVTSPSGRKQDKDDDIFDFDKLTIAKPEKQSGPSGKDVFAVLDTITFQSEPRKTGELI
ncbi:hypothetical protein X943_003460 [Babesia divergens]|uniref:ENTH domain-containing protein n=1 Tax=Babesia divergens TaxID=32595 RepID=A0AAD9GFW2_BABDI|nr:hypothetical protein X943_003460 [Babesia divergens]